MSIWSSLVLQSNTKPKHTTFIYLFIYNCLIFGQIQGTNENILIFQPYVSLIVIEY